MLLERKIGICRRKRGTYMILIGAFTRSVKRYLSEGEGALIKNGNELLSKRKRGIYQKEKGHLLEGKRGHVSK